MNFAIITAAGPGKRMQAGKNKCLLKLKEKEILAWTVEVFEKCSEINCIVLTAGSIEERKEFKKIVEREEFEKVKKIILGGKERQDSVFNGLKAVKELKAGSNDVVLVHNGANPLVKEKEIMESVKAATKFGSSVLAQPVKDTIKRVDENLMVVETLNRKELWRMQTPQVAKFEIFWKAFENAFKEGFYGTDDVQLVERNNGIVKIVECGFENFKITTPEDLGVAEKILEKRSEKK